MAKRHEARRPSLFSLFGGLGGPSSQATTDCSSQGAPQPKTIKAHGEKPAPTYKRVALGVSQSGDIITIPLFERNLLICGSAGSGKSWTANRLLAEIIKIRKQQRVIAFIDCKQGVEAAKWIRAVDGIAIDIPTADTILTNVREEMIRRGNFIRERLREGDQRYWDSKLEPSDTYPMIVVFIDELAVLGNKLPDKEADEVRKHAFNMLNEILYMGRFAGIVVVAAIQRPDASLFGGGFMRNNFQGRLGGRVDSKTSSEVIFGPGSSDDVDASKLRDFWFYASVDGVSGFQKFKTPGEQGDGDLKVVAFNPDYAVDPDRGSWLTAEPDTKESIPPWWRGNGEAGESANTSSRDAYDGPASRPARRSDRRAADEPAPRPAGTRLDGRSAPVGRRRRDDDYDDGPRRPRPAERRARGPQDVQPIDLDDLAEIIEPITPLGAIRLMGAADPTRPDADGQEGIEWFQEVDDDADDDLLVSDDDAMEFADAGYEPWGFEDKRNVEQAVSPGDQVAFGEDLFAMGHDEKPRHRRAASAPAEECREPRVSYRKVARRPGEESLPLAPHGPVMRTPLAGDFPAGTDEGPDPVYERVAVADWMSDYDWDE